MELSSLYLKSGLKNVGIVFLMTDAQVPSESFLVLINDMLSTGEIPELFPDDEVENIIAGVRNEVRFNDFVPLNLTLLIFTFFFTSVIIYVFRTPILFNYNKMFW